MKQLKEYQEKAVSELVCYTKKLLNNKKNATIVLQSPTGSGKTLIATNYIEKIASEIKQDLCFIWLTLGKGQLHEQSMKSVKKEISKEFLCNILEEEYFGFKNSINQNEIVFISWQKIKLKDKETGNWKAIVMKDKETINFIEVLENTRLKNRKIILIIDESHIGTKTEKSIELIDTIIKPNLTIEMSATPIISECNKKIVIDSTEVIESGMIKKEIIINKDLDLIPHNELDSLELVVISAINKQKELKKLYKLEKTNINPLVLIQIPNSTTGEKIKIEVENILKNNEITEKNGKLSIWMNEEKINNEYEKLLVNNSKVEYLIFKQAIDTGWDCPRSQILIKFRETKNIIFEIQTLGRILRMPEAKHYNNENLNIAYVYTNIKDILIKKETYNPNIIKSCKSMIKKDYKPIYLLSYYKQKKEFSITSKLFIQIFSKTFARYFKIDEENNIHNYKINMKKISEFGINQSFLNTDIIYTNTTIKTSEFDSQSKKVLNNDKISILMNQIDLQNEFENIIKNNLNGFTPRKSVFQVKSAIIYTLNKYLNLSPNNNGIIHIQNLVVKNKEIFSKIINDSINDYKILYENRIDTETDLWIDNWTIEDTKNYNPNFYSKIKSNLSLHEPLYIETNNNDKFNEEELSLIKYLDKQQKYIDWFWLNGQEHNQKNFAIKTINKKSFQPNIIIKFKDGRIGIIDIKKTKSIDNYTKTLTLYNYIKESNQNIIGGLIHKDKNNFRIFTKQNYIEFTKDESKWEYLEDIIKNNNK